MMASSSKSGIRGNLRGTSSSSAAIRPSASSAASGQFQYISFAEIEPIPRDISMPDLIELAKRRIYYICMYRYIYIYMNIKINKYTQQNDGDNAELPEIEAILLSIGMLKALKHKNDKSIQAVTSYSRLKRSLVKLSNQSH